MSEIRSNYPGETISQALAKIVRGPVTDANHDYYYRKYPCLSGKEPRSIEDELALDANIQVLGNIYKRKKNILKREGD
jgi:hypothetical protein